ncbi:hypothetical protein [Psychrobacillus sp. MER TA 171]|uniref:hypothetical protein n=1 Tax=Psychrobacillus sp. MER TA 171 TaxID=2939577 RepID=UPI00203D59E8|nr:hypothetical protein [Psychrobacillus sp. MER TA 171]MCM3360114.1 hypothetical protein [Psychrobacillus sp. MER TA 171]
MLYGDNRVQFNMYGILTMVAGVLQWKEKGFIDPTVLVGRLTGGKRDETTTN